MTILTAKPLARRTVLRGLGATLALPVLDAMTPAFARAAEKPAHRFQTFYVPNGMAMEYWLPSTEGAAFELTPILEPLAPFRGQMLVLSGLKANWNYIHAGASGSFLTGTVRGGRNEVEIVADVSMDQLLARHFADQTQVASLELAMDPPNNAGACTGNLSCVYTHTLSWRSKTQPLPMEYNPRAVFERLFGDSGSTGRAAREARLQQQKSLLDSVNEKLAKLRTELGAQDQAKVEQYTEAVRDIERRIQKAEQQADIELPTLEQPQGVPPVFEPSDHWYVAIEARLLSVLGEDAEIEAASLTEGLAEPGGRAAPPGPPGEPFKGGVIWTGEAGSSTADLLGSVLEVDYWRAAAGRSFFWTAGGAGGRPTLHVKAGLPDPYFFSRMLKVRAG